MITLLDFYEQTQLHGATVEHIKLVTGGDGHTCCYTNIDHKAYRMEDVTPWERAAITAPNPFARPSRSNS